MYSTLSSPHNEVLGGECSINNSFYVEGVRNRECGGHIDSGHQMHKGSLFPINVPLILKVREVILLCWKDICIIGHFEGFFEELQTFLMSKLS